MLYLPIFLNVFGFFLFIHIFNTVKRYINTVECGRLHSTLIVYLNFISNNTDKGHSRYLETGVFVCFMAHKVCMNISIEFGK